MRDRAVFDETRAFEYSSNARVKQPAALTPEELAAVQQQVRARMLRWFARADHLEQADARDMAGWHHGGGL